MTHLIQDRAGKSLAVALTVLVLTALALGSGVASASARTFNFNAMGSMVQQSPRVGFACAMRRAMLDRKIPCRGIV
jgi:hypothetical protein